MDREARRARIAEIVAARLEQGDPVGWFDDVYRDAEGDEQKVPWAALAPKPSLLDWLAAHDVVEGAPALCVGCGLGDDAEAIAAAGFDVTAFDVSPTSVAWARRRFPGSPVRYEVADLLELPEAYQNGFAFVFESYTVQSLPLEMRKRVLSCLLGPLAPGGTLLLICVGRDDHSEPSGPPWPVSRAELDHLSDLGLEVVSFRDAIAPDRDVRRFVVEYRAPM